MESPAQKKKNQKKAWGEFNEDKAKDESDDDEEAAAWLKKRGKAPPEKQPSAVPSASNPAMHPSVQAMLDAWEEETDSEDEESTTKKGKRKRDEDGPEASTWIREDADAPLDFMSADAAHSVLTLNPSHKRRRENQGGDFESRADALRFGRGLRIAEDGRLVVTEEETD